MTAPADPAASDLSVSVEESGPVVRTLTIEVGERRVERALDHAYRDLSRRARVQGFRPGKVPRPVLERVYGAAVLDEVTRQLVNETLPEAFERTGLLPVTEPAIDAGRPLAGAAYRYSARIEIKPELVLPDLTGLSAQRSSVAVEDADVARVLEDLRQRHAPLVEEPEGTRAATGHVLTVDFVGRIDGVEFDGGEGKEVEIELGSDRFIPGFEQQLAGAQAGERVEVRVTFPQDYGHAEVAGKDAVFEVQVHTLRRRQPPELDDDFARDLGDLDSLDALRQRVRADLASSRERESRALLERTLLDSLLARISFEVPPGLVERRLQQRLARAHRELEQSVPHDALHAQLDRWAEAWRADAERDVRVALVLEAVAKAREITVDDGAVDARLDEMAAREGVDPAQLRRLYREKDALGLVRSQLVDERALESLIRDAKIEEVPRA